MAWFGLLYALGLAVFGAMGFGLQRAIDALRGPAAAVSPASARAGLAQDGGAAPGPAAAAAPSEASAGRARFDVVRVAPDGQAGIAGRAPPGAMVAVSLDGRVLGTVRADDSGSWLLLPRERVRQGRLAWGVRIVGGR